MAAPGVSVVSRATPPPRGISVNSGTAFMVGEADRGAVDQAVLVQSMNDFTRLFGPRTNYSVLYDALDLYFREGGQRAYVARAVGEDAETASVELDDASSNPTIKVSAANPGAWGNSLNVAITAAGSGSFRVVVSDYALGIVDQSLPLSSIEAAIEWSQASIWVRIEAASGSSELNPAVITATSLVGGADDIEGVDDTIRSAALDLFDKGLGTGQVMVPGNTSSAVRGALIAHAETNNRVALLDATNSPSASGLATEGKSLQGNEYAALVAPWVRIPGVVPGRTRIAPPCAAMAGLIARSDGTKSVNEPAANANGLLRYVLDLSQPRWTEAERESLNEAGVNIFRVLPGSIRLYGFRTLANPEVDRSWLWLNNQRLRMVISEECAQAGEPFVLTQIDGRGLKIAEYAGALAGVLARHWNDGALYGTTPDEAFSVDVGPAINPVSQVEAGELRSALTVKMSPTAERVVIEIVKVAASESL